MRCQTLVDIPPESRDRISLFKKLSTAVSIESPDLFRIHGVPCVDRGPDRLRPPAAYEHWKNCESAGGYATAGATAQPVKITANFARPSSVSADTPNFFKIPGVAINSSSAITGVEAVCSPPPAHQPFKLPESYMHDTGAKPAADRAAVPGHWRETNRDVGQWGHATRQFHEALTEMRREGAARGNKKETSSFNSDGKNTPFNVELRNGSGEETAQYTSALAEQERQLQQQKHQGSKKAAARGGANSASHVLPYRPEFGDSAGERRNGRDVPQEKHTEVAEDAMGTGMKAREDPGRRRRRPSSVEVFMSRLEGNRGPENRRESLETFKRLLRDCPTNNSAQFRDDAALTPNSGSSDGGERARAKASALQAFSIDAKRRIML